MRRRGPWSPRPRRRAAAAAARRAPGSGSEASEGLPRLLAAAVGRRVLLPPPVIGKLSPAISPFLLGTGDSVESSRGLGRPEGFRYVLSLFSRRFCGHVKSDLRLSPSLP
jgi:hypothetical protein